MPASSGEVVVAKTSDLAPTSAGLALSHMKSAANPLWKILFCSNFRAMLVEIIPGQTELTIGDGLVFISNLRG